MFKELKERLFGKWVIVYEDSTAKESTTYWDDSTVKQEAIFIVEKNTKTGKDRCYTLRPNGERTYWDIDYVKKKYGIKSFNFDSGFDFK